MTIVRYEIDFDTDTKNAVIRTERGGVRWVWTLQKAEMEIVRDTIERLDQPYGNGMRRAHNVPGPNVSLKLNGKIDRWQTRTRLEDAA